MISRSERCDDCRFTGATLIHTKRQRPRLVGDPISRRRLLDRFHDGLNGESTASVKLDKR